MYKLGIPENINVIAIPVNYLEYLYSLRDDRIILVIKKKYPRSPEFRCGARHYFWFNIDMLPKGGILLGSLNNIKWIRKYEKCDCIYGKVGTITVKGYLERKLPSATFYFEVSDWNWVNKGEEDKIDEMTDELARHVFEEIKLVIAKQHMSYLKCDGYLVFQREKGNVWKLVKDKEPEAFIYLISHSVHSREHEALLKVENVNGLLSYVDDFTATKLDSICAYLLLLKYPSARVKVKYNKAPYRGEQEIIEKVIEITYKDGKVEENEITEYEPESVI